jgi:HlyD family secretion protein
MAVHGATSFEREQINAKLNAAREQFAFAEKSFRRIENMMKDSLIAMQKYDEVFEKYQSAKAQLDAVKAQKDDIDHGVRKEKTDMAFGDMKRAEGVLKEVQTAYNERFICAPKNMTIETIAVKQGELALPGYNMFVGYETEGTYFRFTVNEDRVANFEKGKTYQVEVPALKKTIPAKLTGIKQLASYADKTSSYANYELGETVYELKLIPVNPEETAQLYSNMTVLMNK